MRRVMLANMLLGIWLMVAPFILSLINKSVVEVLWEDCCSDSALRCARSAG